LFPDQLSAFINSAHHLIQANLLGGGLSEEILTEIHKYLAAHFASLRDQRLQAEKIADVNYTYQGQTAMFFESTFYGQMALSLDSTGKLATLHLKPATFVVFDTPKHGSNRRP
jgi:hypothetical protein